MDPRDSLSLTSGGAAGPPDGRQAESHGFARWFLILTAAAIPGTLAFALSPILGLWYLWQRSWRSKHGLRVLLPAQARTLAAFAEAAIPSGEPPEVWTGVARTVDSYLAGFHSPRKWRSVWLWTALEWVPLTRCQPPFSRMDLDSRQRYCEARFRTNRGIHGALATGRQLVRMGYYARFETQRGVGFVPWDARGVKLDMANGAQA